MTQAIISDYWNHRAEAYHHYHVFSDRAEADLHVWSEIFGRFLPVATSRVLDVGTGDGYVAHILSDRGFDVVGVDASPGMLMEARLDAEERVNSGRPAARFVEGDATQLAPELSGFDAVTSRFLMWTLREPVTAVRGWAQRVVPGGVIIAADANWFGGGVPEDTVVESSAGADSFVKAYNPTVLHDLPLSTVTSPDEYAEVFREAGLSEVHVTWLPEILALDRKFGTAPGHESIPHFVVTGRV
ncbi:class I SAM-dependent methyltransferase [Corynebacterium pyruviciproducens]